MLLDYYAINVLYINKQTTVLEIISNICLSNNSKKLFEMIY